MTNNEILLKALQKAQKNIDILTIYEMNSIEEWVDWLITLNISTTVIFSHVFAKAFWGEFKGDGKLFMDGEAPDGFTENGWPKCKRDWRYHIQKMVLEPEPLKYLEKFL